MPQVTIPHTGSYSLQEGDLTGPTINLDQGDTVRLLDNQRLVAVDRDVVVHAYETVGAPLTIQESINSLYTNFNPSADTTRNIGMLTGSTNFPSSTVYNTADLRGSPTIATNDSYLLSEMEALKTTVAEQAKLIQFLMDTLDDKGLLR